MNNVFAMYKAEIKKILLKKSVWLALGIGLLLVFLVGLTNLSADGHSAYVEYQEQVLVELSGQKLDQAFIEGFQSSVENEIQNNWDAYEKISTYDPGTMYMNASSAVGKKSLYDLLYNVVRDRDKITSITEQDFYEAMREDIMKDGRELGVSDEELNTWLETYDTIEKPIDYSYALAYQNLLEVLFIVGWMLIICISIALSGVFADEKTNRTDALILSTRYGRMPICIAKILAGVTVALFQAILLLGGCLSVMFAIYGTCGWNAMIQNIIPSSPWNITIGKMVIIYVAFAIVISLFFTTSNLLISHVTRSAMITMACHAAVIFAGLFNMPAKLGIIAKLWELRPTMPLYYGTFCNTYRYGRFNNVQASFLIYGVCIVGFLIVLIMTYRRSQVESR